MIQTGAGCNVHQVAGVVIERYAPPRALPACLPAYLQGWRALRVRASAEQRNHWQQRALQDTTQMYSISTQTQYMMYCTFARAS